MSTYVYIAVGCDWPGCGEESPIEPTRRQAREMARDAGWGRRVVPSVKAGELYGGSPAEPSRMGDVCPSHASMEADRG